ncbi:ubiquitin carboxyl-terminal hydrolase [Trichophyton mentagrophytes]|nr:ubiquitin carboxyl-terminal hydrolase [Trichophyton mentagrophytes]
MANNPGNHTSNTSNKNSRGRLRLFYSDWGLYFRNTALVSAGIRNGTGVLCYRNCILTALLHQPLFVNWLMLHLLNHGSDRSEDSEKCFVCLLGRLVDEYWTPYPSIQLEAILSRLWEECSQFWDTHSTNQQDCIEFLTRLISQIDNSTYTGDIQHIFQNVFKYRSTCQTCQHTKYSEKDHSWVLGASPPEQRLGSLEDCIQEYMKPEEIAGYHCGNCDSNSTLHREMFIKDAPEVLVIQITRLKVSESGESSKVTAEVQFAEDLDLTERLLPQARSSGDTLRYQLTSVIVHRGATIKEGHYMSYVKGPRGTWTCLNDDFSCEADINVILGYQDDNNVPYVLIYNRLPLFRGSHGAINDDPATAGNYPIAGRIGRPLQANANETLSNERGISKRIITPGQPQTQQGEKATVEVDDSTNDLIEVLRSSNTGLFGSPDSIFRWEVQPAKVDIEITMGGKVFRGAVQGLFESGQKRPRPDDSGETGATQEGSVNPTPSPLRGNNGGKKQCLPATKNGASPKVTSQLVPRPSTMRGHIPGG